MKDPKKLGSIQGTPLQKALRDSYTFPSMGFARDIAESPTMRLAREFQESPTMRAIRELAQNDKFTEVTRLATQIPDGFAETWAQHDFTKLTTAGAWGSAMVGKFADFSALTRANHWASLLNESSVSKLSSLWGAQSASLGELQRIRHVAAAFAAASPQFDGINHALGLSKAFSSELELTRLKLSAFAGAGDVLGFGAQSSFAAYERLFGTWHTNPGLPDLFWHDTEMRRRFYGEAQVDEGLIEISPSVALDIAVGSGLAAGVAEDDLSVAVVHIPGASMAIRSTDISRDCFVVISAFEQSLRLFIANKLEKAAGAKWMKQRVDGPAYGKARRNREAALVNGEHETSLISFLDLGDLVSIILRKDNWSDVFSGIFPNRDRLNSDFETLIATRRPTMHAREIDAVQLVELMCIVRRLSQWIDGDGDWLRSAEADD